MEDRGLLAAARNGQQERVASLIRGKRVNINCRDINGKTPLHLAAMNRHTEIVEYLLKKGARCDIKCNSDGYTALHEATIAQDTKAILCLMEHGSYSIEPDLLKWTPMHYGAVISEEHLTKEAFESLLQGFISTRETVYVIPKNARRYLNLKNIEGESPLYLAIRSLRVIRVRQLLRAGAQVNLKNKSKKTPFESALSLYVHSDAKRKMRNQIMSDLLRAGASSDTLASFLRFTQKVLQKEISLSLTAQSVEAIHSNIFTSYFDCKRKGLLEGSAAKNNTTYHSQSTSQTQSHEVFQQLTKIEEDLKQVEITYKVCIEAFKKRYKLKSNINRLICEDYFKIRGDTQAVFTLKWLLIEGLFKIRTQNSYFKKLPNEMVHRIWEFAVFPALTAHGISKAGARSLVYTLFFARYNTQCSNHAQQASILDCSTMKACHCSV